MDALATPKGRDVSQLLKERYSIPASFTVECTLDRIEGQRRTHVRLVRPSGGGRTVRDEFLFEIRHLKGGVDSWDLLLDATDAIVGTLVESEYAHRNVPSGDDLQFQDGLFSVSVIYRRPDVEDKADSLLHDA